VKKQFAARERKRAPAEAVLVGAGGGGGDIAPGADDYNPDDIPPGPEQELFQLDESAVVGGLNAHQTYLLSWGVLLMLIGMLITHRWTEHLLGAPGYSIAGNSSLN